MTRAEAIKVAQEVASEHGCAMAVVWEGPHRDEFEEADSHGLCPVRAVPVLYKYGRITDTVQPDGTVRAEAQP